LISGIVLSVQVTALLTVVHAIAGLKVAVTAVATLIDTVQVPLPLQPPPDQPVKLEPALALAVRTTLVP
jgi:hypothetical protein